MIKKSLISHVGIAVQDLDEAIKQYTIITGSSPEIEDVPEQKVKVAIFKNEAGGGEGNIELLSATMPDSPISKFVEKNGEGLHHVCIYVKDIEKKLTELKDAGFRLINEKPLIGAVGNKIAFVHPKDCHGVLIELEEA